VSLSEIFDLGGGTFFISRRVFSFSSLDISKPEIAFVILTKIRFSVTQKVLRPLGLIFSFVSKREHLPMKKYEGA
jgi:hypothetical protein